MQAPDFGKNQTSSKKTIKGVPWKTIFHFPTQRSKLIRSSLDFEMFISGNLETLMLKILSLHAKHSASREVWPQTSETFLHPCLNKFSRIYATGGELCGKRILIESCSSPTINNMDVQFTVKIDVSN
jgi:hypothetical protein